MTKTYSVAYPGVDDPIADEAYKANDPAAFVKLKCSFIIRDGQETIKEGSLENLAAVMEFQDYQTALACN
jgi:uncharacterized protein (DUF1330 family)